LSQGPRRRRRGPSVNRRGDGVQLDRPRAAGSRGRPRRPL